MAQPLTPSQIAKAAAAARAAQMVQDGMIVGLGTGSTAEFLVRDLGRRVRDEGLRIRAVPTSSRTAAQAGEEGIEVVSLDDVAGLDLAIDGADEFDPEFNLIKGGGGAHLQEKIVAAASQALVVIADASKEVQTLGAFPLPVEVVPFGLRSTSALVEEALIGLDVLGRDVELRLAGAAPFVTDEGNRILDLRLQRIGDARQLSVALNQIPGVVENGLFIDLCKTVVVGFPDGSTEMRDKDAGPSVAAHR